MVTDALVLGLFGAAPLVLAAVGFTLTGGARLDGNRSQRFGTVTHGDRVPPRARGDA
jgi:hypothetical protein